MSIILLPAPQLWTYRILYPLSSISYIRPQPSKMFNNKTFIEFISLTKSPTFQKQLVWKIYRSLDYVDRLLDRGLNSWSKRTKKNLVRESIEVIIPGQREMQRTTEKGDWVSVWLELENGVGWEAEQTDKNQHTEKSFSTDFVNEKNWKQKTDWKYIKKINIFPKKCCESKITVKTGT